MSWILNNGHWITMFGGVIAVAGVFISDIASDKKSQQIVALNEELRSYESGGDSYIYLHASELGTASAKVSIRHVGKFPVKEIDIQIYDVTEQMPAISMGQAAKFDLNPEKMTKRTLRVIHPDWDRYFVNSPLELDPKRSFYTYFVHFDAHNGRHREILTFKRLEGDWYQAYVVHRADEENYEHRTAHIDKELIAELEGFTEAVKNIASGAQPIPES